MQEYPTALSQVIHSLSTQFTDLSTAYTQPVHMLFYPASTLDLFSLQRGHCIYTRMSRNLSTAS